jgi:hypothetical protein
MVALEQGNPITTIVTTVYLSDWHGRKANRDMRDGEHAWD